MTKPGKDTAADALKGLLGLPASTDPADVARIKSAVLDHLDGAPEEIGAWASAVKDRINAPTKPDAALLRAQRAVRVLSILLALVTGVGLVVGVYFLGDRTDPAAAAPHGTLGSQTQALPLDQAKVNELQAKLKTSPNDVGLLTQLGAVYFKAERYLEASEQYQKVVGVEPNNLDARLTLGVCYFNVADYPGAEEQWLRAVEIDPKSPHPHYNLGFLYVAMQPPRYDQARLHWEKVGQLDPGSDLAKNAADHVGRLASMQASGPASPKATP